jgi:hypothetical protein
LPLGFHFGLEINLSDNFFTGDFLGFSLESLSVPCKKLRKFRM